MNSLKKYEFTEHSPDRISSFIRQNCIFVLSEDLHMKLNIQSRSFELTAALDAYIRNKLNQALSRVAPPQTEVTISLSDINGPRGGEDKQCQMLFALPGVGLFVIKDRKADLYHAIDSASQRARHAVSRAVTRRRKRKNGRGKPAPDYVPGNDESAQPAPA